MELYADSRSYKLYHGNMLDMLEVIEPNTIDSVVTDPPYELNFMAKGWDNTGVAFQAETWRRCFEVLKPGGYLLAFGGSRTFHRIAVAIEDAGFEITDTIIWMYGSGFPKSMSIGKCVESKLVNGSAQIADIKKLDGEVIAYQSSIGRFETEQGYTKKDYTRYKTNVIFKTEEGKKWDGWGTCLKPAYEPVIVARKPCDDGSQDRMNMDVASRYFYCAKASKQDRDEGLDQFEEKRSSMLATNANINADGEFTGMLAGRDTAYRNTHPTVKPCDLMQYLVRLVTPKGGTVLDPFNGSGSTGKACMCENRDRNSDYTYIGIELTDEYLPIADARIKYALNSTMFLPSASKKKPVANQINLFDFVGE